MGSDGATSHAVPIAVLIMERVVQALGSARQYALPLHLVTPVCVVAGDTRATPS